MMIMIYDDGNDNNDHDDNDNRIKNHAMDNDYTHFFALLLTWFIKDILRDDEEAQTCEQEAAHCDASDDS